MSSSAAHSVPSIATKSSIALVLGLSIAVTLGCRGRSPAPSHAGEGEGEGEEQPPVLELSHAKQGQGGAFVDMDGDGRDDKVVGAPWASLGPKLGVVLVYPGTDSGFSPTASLRLTGDDNLGFAVQRLADVDGDGHAEVAVSALTGDGEDSSLSGSVTIYRGGTSGIALAHLAFGQAGAKFGYSLAHGDLNADGADDLVVGAPYHTADPALYQQGAVHVYFGPNFTTRASLIASNTNKGLGWAVAVGDADADGTDDLLVGAKEKVLGYRGGAGFAPAIDAPELTVTSTASAFGRSLAVTDRHILLGAPKATVGDARDTGALYVLTRAAMPRTIDLASAPADLVVTINGAARFARFSNSLALAGDVDGDGMSDFVVGATGADVGDNDMRGRVYLFMGKDISAETTLASSTAFDGTAPFQAFGTTLVPGAAHSLLIGAPGDAGDVGRVFVVDLATGQPVAGGETGGSTGEGETCEGDHCH
jgi:FG-GAP repeat